MRSCRPKNRIIMIPSQKLGIDWPSMAMVMIEPSSALPRLSAAKTPRGMASDDGEDHGERG